MGKDFFKGVNMTIKEKILAMAEDTAKELEILSTGIENLSELAKNNGKLEVLNELMNFMVENNLQGVTMPPRYFNSYEEAAEYERNRRFEEEEKTEEERQQEEDEYWEKVDEMIDELRGK